MNKTWRKAEIRGLSDDGLTLTARVVNYNVVDDYDTIFLPQVFKESLLSRMPTLAWSHDWSEPLGHAVDYNDSEEGLTVEFRFDNPDDVPMVRRAISQIRSGTLKDVSVGFMPHETTQVEGKTAFSRADLDEVSIVLRGAVPNAKILALRSAQRSQVVDAEYAAGLVAAFASGNATLVDTLQRLQDAAVNVPDPAEEAETPEEEAAEDEDGEDNNVVVNVNIDVDVDTDGDDDAAPESPEDDSVQLVAQADDVFGGVLSA